MKTLRIEVITLKIKDKTANQVNLRFSSKVGGTAITETDLEFKKVRLTFKNFPKIVFEVLTTISCSLKALDRFT